MSFLPEGRSIWLYATMAWDEWGSFQLTSSLWVSTVQHVESPYAAAWGRFETTTLQLQGTEHTNKPPCPLIKDVELANCTQVVLEHYFQPIVIAA